jgi:hypothetical protein
MLGGYELRLRGKLSRSTLQAFEGFTATEREGDTILRGDVQDDAALYGLINTAESLGLRLLEVRPVKDAARAAPEERAGRSHLPGR